MPEENPDDALIGAFVRFLTEERGYTQDQLKSHFVPAAVHSEIDLVVHDRRHSSLLAVFEFKRSHSRLRSRGVRDRFLAFLRTLSGGVRAAYLVGPGDSAERPFTIYQVFDEDRFEEVPESGFPTFEALLNSPRMRLSQMNQTDDKEAVDKVAGATKTSVPSPSPSPRIESITPASVSDQPTANDSLGFTPYVDAIARFLLNDDTRPPLTLSVEGEWGSGKSSFMKQLRQRLLATTPKAKKRDEPQIYTVWFNAWRHDKSDALWAAFALEFIEQISQGMSVWDRWRSAWGLTKKRFDWSGGWFDIARWIFVLLAWITLSVTGIYLWCLGAFTVEGLLNGKELSEWGNGLLGWGMASGGVFSFLAGSFFVLKQASSILGNPLKHELKKHLKTVDYADRVAFIEKFHNDFSKIVSTYVGDNKVFVFIDDLDRCEVPTAAELMQALNLMIADENPIVFIVGMDREKVAAGIAAKHEKLLPYLADDSQKVSGGKPSDTYAVEFGLSFIEKFIQLPFRIPAPGPDNLDGFLSALRGTAQTTTNQPEVSPGKVADSGQSELEKKQSAEVAGSSASASDTASPSAKKEVERRWNDFELRVAQDSKTIHGMVRMVAPALDYNPRKLKQFINVFRLQSYICFDTGLFNPPSDSLSSPLSFERLAKITAVSLRWPMFMSDLEIEPKLFEKVAKEKRTSDTGTTEPIAPIVGRWQARERLVNLLRFYPSDSTTHGILQRFTLAGFDVAQLLRVWPSVKRTAKKPEPETPSHSTGASEDTNDKDAQDEFLSITSLRALLTGSGRLQPDEEITGELLIFRTSRQMTLLLVTNRRVFILLDDPDTRRESAVIQASFAREQTLPLRFKKDSANEHSVGFAALKEYWYYSVELFPSPEALRDAVENLVKSMSA